MNTTVFLATILMVGQGRPAAVGESPGNMPRLGTPTVMEPDEAGNPERRPGPNNRQVKSSGSAATLAFQPTGPGGAENSAKDPAKANGTDKEKDNDKYKKKEPYPSAIFGPHLPDGPQGRGFFHSLVRAYVKEFRKADDDNGDDSPPPARRAMPEPWSSPPFPGHEYQGYPLIGVPPETSVYPLMQAVYDSTEGTHFGQAIKDSKVKVDGWIVASGNFSTAKTSNLPTSYWVVPNRFEMDQGVVRIARDLDSVQTDHVDWGFRSIHLYGIDYRYTTAGGYVSDQLLRHNRLYGYDPTEQYFDVYIPWVAQGMIIRVGRWIACPDIETQYGPDNYTGSHSLLFTYDSYTQSGVMVTFKLSDQVMVQGAIHAGTDMAPWYKGATPTGFFGLRLVSADNNDSLYTCLNNINDARFRRLEIDGQTAGHDNFNYIVSTWEHTFNKEVHTKTEAYFMWQRDAYVGGTVSVGPPQDFGGGGGAGTFIPGYSINYGVLNYTMFAVSKNDYFTVRNELWNDPQGERTGFRSLYSSHTIGWSHNFNSVFTIRPELGFYHSYGPRTFDLGATRNMIMGGFDMIWRF